MNSLQRQRIISLIISLVMIALLFTGWVSMSLSAGDAHSLLPHKFSDSYSAFTFRNFADEHHDYVYWILFDLWGHHAEDHISAFGASIHAIAWIVVIINAVNVFMWLTVRKSRYFFGIASSACSAFIALLFLIWMGWFSTALVAYDGIRTLVHLRLSPFLRRMLSREIFNITQKRPYPR